MGFGDVAAAGVENEVVVAHGNVDIFLWFGGLLGVEVVELDSFCEGLSG